MKILLVNSYYLFGGGDSTYTFNLAQLLKEQRHNIAFFAMQEERSLPDPNSDLFVSNIDYRVLNRKKNLITGFKVLGRSIYSLEAKRKFNRLLNRFKPDIIHLQNIHHHITPSIIFKAKRHKLPVVWTLHDYKLVCPNTHFIIDKTGQICEACGDNSYYRTILKRCKKGSLLASMVICIEAYIHFFLKVKNQVDIFLTPSIFLRNKLLSHKFPSEKIRHLPLFLPDDYFHYTPSNEGYFLFLGKVEPIKGIYQLFEACRLAPQIKLILAGRVDESMANELPRLLTKNVQYIGLKHGEELKNLLRNARALVLPSLCYENQPFSILETFAAGKPVITSNIGGMAELVKDKERGLLVPPGDTRALVNAMEWMQTHPDEAMQMGKNAYEYARKFHSQERHYQELMKIYHEVRA